MMVLLELMAWSSDNLNDVFLVYERTIRRWWWCDAGKTLASLNILSELQR